MPEYTVAAGASVLVIVAFELLILRTGLFRRPAYWVTLAIVWAFQIPVDGWLTKLSAPIVLYAPDQATGIRFPWDIPVEDFAFGFSLVTVTLLLWERRSVPGRAASRRRRPASPDQGPAPGH
jgi:lycopene cyclase domain-containing protein